MPPKLTVMKGGKSNPTNGTGIDVKTVVLVTVLTTVASQFVIDAYRAVKQRLKTSKEEKKAAAPAANPPALPPGQQMPMYAAGAPAASPWAQPHAAPMPAAMGGPRPPQEYQQPPGAQMPMQPPPPPSTGAPGLTRDELEAWQRQLERREGRLEEWQQELDSTQRHLRLVQGS